MTVYELIKELTYYDADAEVIFHLDCDLETDEADDLGRMHFDDNLDCDDVRGKKYLSGEECWINFTY